MNKITMHFISHTHWDREWYMSFEEHRMKLVLYFDILLDTLEKDKDFKSFFLDGQIAMIEDYLKVRPQNEEKIKEFMKEGRLHFGPWYILQDEYLISGEANIRNMELGMYYGRKYGNPSAIGYLPDSFGNISQMPQILRGFGITNAVFGRGINSIGFNNLIDTTLPCEEYPSEVMWASPDGSEVLGIFMANWYNNASEVPSDIDEAIAFIKEIQAKSQRYATTSHLLMMNGCDHQPVQINIAQILKKVQPLMPDVELIHSNLSDYINRVGECAKNLKTVVGELNSRKTNGLATLVNTASTKMYLKQQNHKAQNLLEKYVEPIETLAYLNGKSYDEDIIRLAWKKLLLNHPHDSICGCNVDEVSRGMIARYDQVVQLGDAILKNGLDYIISQSEDEDIIPISVFNSINAKREETIEVVLDINEEGSITGGILYDEDKVEVPYELIDCGIVFTYTLPNDRFRQVHYKHRYKLRFNAYISTEIGLQMYYFNKSASKTESELLPYMENRYLKLNINQNGSIDVTYKETGDCYKGLNIYESVTDSGDEYMFFEPPCSKRITTESNAAIIELIKNTPVEQIVCITNVLSVPKGISYSCNVQKVLDYARRAPYVSISSENVDIHIKTYVRLTPNSKRIDIRATVHNTAENHRLRTVFATDIQSTHHFADGQFDVLKRENKMCDWWKNPSSTERQQAFVAVEDNERGIMIVNKGIPEYEVSQTGDNVVAITLLRCVGELGDWGYFPTQDSQCIGEFTFEISIIPYTGGWLNSKSHQQAYAFNTPALAKSGSCVGNIKRLIEIDNPAIVISAIKKANTDNGFLIRLYNVSENEVATNVSLCDLKAKEAYRVNFNEEKIESIIISSNQFATTFGAKEIKTFIVL